MSGISLTEVLKTRSLQNAKILAGRNALNRLVTGVTVGEVPDIANWLTGGELVLSTFYAVSRNVDGIRSFAKRIINGPATALAVKPARFLEVLPPDILDLAEELDFPIIEIPPDIRWTTIIADVYEIMARANTASNAGEIENELLQAAIDGRGLKSIALTTSRKLDAPVIIYDLLDGIVAEETPTEPFPKDLIDLFVRDDERFAGNFHEPRGISGRPVVERLTVDGSDVFASHVLIGLETVAFVATVVPDNLDEATLSILKKAAEATAIEIARTRAIEEAKARAYGDFLNDLISGRIPYEQVDAQLIRLGVDISQGFAVLYCPFSTMHLFGRFYRDVSRAVRNEAKGSLLMEHDAGLAVILAQTGETAKISKSNHTRNIAKRILAIAEMLDSEATIGISRVRSRSTEIVRALDEAKVALDFGCRVNGNGSMTDFDQVGIYRLLLPLAREAKDDGRLYYEETVGRLAEYDNRHGTELLDTLESFYRNSENIALTAEKLYTHRHTIRYRLQRIAEITGFDPFDGSGRERLYMGLHVKYLLNL